MAKTPVIEEHQLRNMISIAGITGEAPARDAALLSVLYGTGVVLTELASMRVSDYLTEPGGVRNESVIRAEISHNNIERPLFWVNPKVVTAVDAYLVFRVREGQGISTRAAAYRGLDPDSSLFLRIDGAPYALMGRKLASGGICYSCDSLSHVIRKLHMQAGVEGHAEAARRTFAVRLHQKGYDLRYIATLLGHRSLTATRRLVDGAAVNLGDIVYGVL
jgi:site-specific recombinase XerD